jgi:hypothetical protein
MRNFFSDFIDRSDKIKSTAVGKIVPGDRRNNHIIQIQVPNRFRNPYRFLRIRKMPGAVGNSTKSTVTRATIAHNHKGCGLSGKAFPNVGTLRFLTDGMNFCFADQGADLFMDGPGGQSLLEPDGFSRTFLLFVMLCHVGLDKAAPLQV